MKCRFLFSYKHDQMMTTFSSKLSQQANSCPVTFILLPPSLCSESEIAVCLTGLQLQQEEGVYLCKVDYEVSLDNLQ